MRTRWVSLVAAAGTVTVMSLPATSVAHASRHTTGAPAVEVQDVALQPAVRIRGLRSFTVAATGDIISENAVLDAGSHAAAGTAARYDFGPLFAPTAPILRSATLAICHMETPIGRPDQRPGNYGPSPFGGNRLLEPYEMAAAVRDAGYDRCTTSSNHSNDLGVDGINSTLDALDEVGVSHVGTARTPGEAVARTFDVNGVRVAHLAYTRVTNTDPVPDPWRLNFASSVGQVVNDIAAARAAGAEVVILSIHLGKELLPAPLPNDRKFVEDITAATHVDLVIEHGPHVIQPIEQVNGTWVFWSVGNFLEGMGRPGLSPYPPRTLDGLLAWAQFTEVQPGVFTVTPSSVLVCDEEFGRVVYPALTTLADPTITTDLRQQLEACVARSTPIVPSIS